LGPKTSEAKARDARYKFLEEVKAVNKAKAIVTAHHQDDVLETAILNMLRGTGRRGLTSLQNRKNLIRPLLKFSKAAIKNYAKSHKLKWREDSTNENNAANEVMAAWLRVNKLSIDRKKLNTLSIAAKTFVPGKKVDINKAYSLLVEKRTLKLV
jgi:tRNA(Ile)-lysidine synthase TilS/MesJ